MVEVPDALNTLFSAQVESDGDRYVVEIPKREVSHGALAPGETYRVGLLSQVDGETATSTPEPARETDSVSTSSGVPQPPVDEGEVREVTIESLGDQGDGIAKVERGYVVIVPDGQPGDSPTVEIETVQENVAFASVVDTDGQRA
ncbi:TRAM domain-containing protein [Haloarcula salina]|uniref:TRAM domain-containing protein n=1 Tax=Haloarcula salina TaxID=1429914 RepID=A0AA41KEF2_9EURY|nr:TRAM domain-containing protein [Haloarcula salina]MBV0900822.1 TRAM domain-containing protein [Haloarcula salina]